MTGALQFNCPGCARPVASVPLTTSVACVCGAVFDLTVGRMGATVRMRREERAQIRCRCGAAVAIGHIPRWTLLIVDGTQYPGEAKAHPCPECRSVIPIPPIAQAAAGVLS